MFDNILPWEQKEKDSTYRLHSRKSPPSYKDSHWLILDTPVCIVQTHSS